MAPEEKMTSVLSMQRHILIRLLRHLRSRITTSSEIRISTKTRVRLLTCAARMGESRTLVTPLDADAIASSNTTILVLWSASSIDSAVLTMVSVWLCNWTVILALLAPGRPRNQFLCLGEETLSTFYGLPYRISHLPCVLPAYVV